MINECLNPLLIEVKIINAKLSVDVKLSKRKEIPEHPIPV
jgi:hypothetical protein